MELINTDDLVLLGPGSEWFWTAVSGVVLAVTFIAIYRQLALARSANAFEQIARTADAWGSERAIRHRLAVLESLEAGTAPERIPEGAASYIADFWEQCAALVHAGHIDSKIIYNQFGPSIRYWWAVVAPNVHRYRTETGVTSTQHFEWLAQQMADRDRARGISQSLDLDYVRSTLELRIERLRDEIRLAEELRAVDVRRRDAATAAADSRTPARPRRKPQGAQRGQADAL